MNTPTLSIIAAVAADGAIGRRGDLIAHIPADMRHFRDTTMGHPVIMGRRTWQSLPGGALPGRRNMVLSRDPNFTAAGADTYPSLTDALKAISPDEQPFIIGGQSLYTEALPLAHTLYLTEIDTVAPDADTFFPDIDPGEWTAVETSVWHEDPRSKLKYRFVCLRRK